MFKKLMSNCCVVIVLVCILFLYVNPVFAHSGRTDSSGGHKCIFRPHLGSSLIMVEFS